MIYDYDPVLGLTYFFIDFNVLDISEIPETSMSPKEILDLYLKQGIHIIDSTIQPIKEVFNIYMNGELCEEPVIVSATEKMSYNASEPDKWIISDEMGRWDFNAGKEYWEI